MRNASSQVLMKEVPIYFFEYFMLCPIRMNAFWRCLCNLSLFDEVYGWVLGVNLQFAVATHLLSQRWFSGSANSCPFLCLLGSSFFGGIGVARIALNKSFDRNFDTSFQPIFCYALKHLLKPRVSPLCHLHCSLRGLW